jgi:hypothetical protein
LRPVLLLALALPMLAGCGLFSGRPVRRSGNDVEAALESSERSARESRTISNLAALEKSLGDFVRHEGRIPENLDLLVPKYAAEIPPVDTGVGGHRASSNVTYYRSDVIRDRVVDGSRLKDTGGWGYAYNDRQVILFVDCTHSNSRKRPWYREAGIRQ